MNENDISTKNGVLKTVSQTNWCIKWISTPLQLFALFLVITLFGAILGALVVYLAGGCRDSNNNDNGVSSDNVCLTPDCVQTAASLISTMDSTVDPCDDFYQYACGSWLANNDIPDDKTSNDITQLMSDKMLLILKNLLEGPVNSKDNQATMKTKMFYKSCVDKEKIRKIGLGSLLDDISKLGGWPIIEKNWTHANASLEHLLGTLGSSYDESAFFSLMVRVDDKNSSRHLINIDQPSLLLPSREYYLDPNSTKEVEALSKYITQVAILFGGNPASISKDVEDLIQLERTLARVQIAETDLLDRNIIYLQLTLGELQDQIPLINWTECVDLTFGGNAALQSTEPIVTYTMPYLIALGEVLEQTDRRVIQNYVILRVLMDHLKNMIDEYEKIRTEFQKVVYGVQSEEKRWVKCLGLTTAHLYSGLSYLFVRDHFDQQIKKTSQEMVHNIRAVFNELLLESNWMDDVTRAVAKDKADDIKERIGYANIISNVTELENHFENLTISEGNFVKNILDIYKWNNQRNVQKLREPVYSDKFEMDAAEINAAYIFTANAIELPAGILQAPFYSQKFPNSLNYGGIGTVIGHEITHGFDDIGRTFDKNGNLIQWWDNATISTFRERAKCFIDQYSRYEVDGIGLKVNGELTLGENIADNGGLKQAFRAYQKWVAKHGMEPHLPGLNLSHNQLFFLNFAQSWCGETRPEQALSSLRTDPHPPYNIRVMGTLSNSMEFSEAYKCPEGSRMNPVEKCSVW